MFRFENYLTDKGGSPFIEWLRSIRDLRARVLVRARLDRAELGNLGDYKSVGDGVFELRIFHGPGYRVYFSLERDNVMLLLLGGIKKTQWRDIQIAKAYLANHRKRENGNK